MVETDLRKSIEEYILHGDFVTSDFRPTKWFVYLENAVNSEEFISLVIKEMEKRNLFKEITAVAGLSWLSSSLLLARNIAERKNKNFTIIDFPTDLPLKTELIRTDIRGYVPTSSDKVLVVECVLSSGFSLLKGCEVISETGATPVGFVIANRDGRYLKKLRDDMRIETDSLFMWHEFQKPKRGDEELDLSLVREQHSVTEKIFGSIPQEMSHERRPKQDTSKSTDFDFFINENVEILRKVLEKCRTENISDTYLRKWLEQFGDNKRRKYALKLLENVEIYNNSRIRESFREIHKYLTEKLGEKIVDKYTIFVPLGPPGKSGHNALYFYRTREHGVLDIMRWSAHALFLNEDFTSKECLVFVDDFIGINGTQAIRYLEEFYEIPSNLGRGGILSIKEKEKIEKFLELVDKYYIAVVGFESGMKNIKDRTGINVLVGDVLTESQKAFAKNGIFLDRHEREEARTIMKDIGEKIFAEGPLGWDNNEALVVFSHNTPTNTLPIFWAHGRKDFEWLPIFPRFDVVKEDLLKAERRLEAPFRSISEEDISQINENMPLLNYFKSRIRNASFTNKKFLIVLHFLKDIIPFMQVCERIGLEPSNTIHFCKKYRYPHQKAITGHLNREGYRIYPLNELSDILSKFERELEKDDKVIVIEDGGYIASTVFKNNPDLSKKIIGCVEQTTKGIRQDCLIKNLTFPILSVADSDLKRRYEPPHVADAVVNNIRRLLPDVNFRGQNALVIGYGSIGKEIAEQLRKSMNVTVYDTNPDRLVEASQRVNIARNLQESSKSKFLVIGATGETSIKSSELLAMDHNTYLVSASSDQKEIGVEELKALSTNRKAIFHGKEKIGTTYTLRTTKRVINLVADGYPINFWATESMPNQVSDLILTLILFSAIEIADNYDKMKAGIDKEKVNKIAKKRKISEKYLDFYHR